MRNHFEVEFRHPDLLEVTLTEHFSKLTYRELSDGLFDMFYDSLAHWPEEGSMPNSYLSERLYLYAHLREHFLNLSKCAPEDSPGSMR